MTTSRNRRPKATAEAPKRSTIRSAKAKAKGTSFHSSNLKSGYRGVRQRPWGKVRWPAAPIAASAHRQSVPHSVSTLAAVRRGDQGPEAGPTAVAGDV